MPAPACLSVAINDQTDEILKNALSSLDTRLSRQVALDRLCKSERDAILGRISPSRALNQLGQSDLVIEAASENEAVKLRIFEELSPYLAPETLLSSNTSSISITRLAACTDRPERFMGGTS